MQYQEILVGDTVYEFPNDMSDEDIQTALTTELGQFPEPQPSSSSGVPPLEGDHLPRQAYRSFGEVPESIEASGLVNNEDWLKASALVFQMRNRKPFDGSPEELSDWGRSHMAYFNYNLLSKI